MMKSEWLPLTDPFSRIRLRPNQIDAFANTWLGWLAGWLGWQLPNCLGWAGWLAGSLAGLPVCMYVRMYVCLRALMDDGSFLCLYG